MDKPKTKQEALAQLEELKAYINNMPEDAVDILGAKAGDTYYYLGSGGKTNEYGAVGYSPQDYDFYPSSCLTTCKRTAQANAKYLNKTAKFRMMALYFANGFEPDWSDRKKSKYFVYMDEKWEIYSTATCNEPLGIHFKTGEDAEKFKAWCEAEYPNGIGGEA